MAKRCWRDTPPTLMFLLFPPHEWWNYPVTDNLKRHTVPCHAPCATESKLSLKAEPQCACVYTHPQKHFGCHRCFFGVYSGYSLKRICLIGSSVIAPVEFILNYSFLVVLESYKELTIWPDNIITFYVLTAWIAIFLSQFWNALYIKVINS